MDKVDKDNAILVTLVDRFVMLSLPRVLSLRKKMLQGHLLSDMDIVSLKCLIQNALDNRHYIDDKPEMHPIFAWATSLYCEVVHRAMQNEENSLRLK